ncbi:hypothetical protein Leryth_014101 [Lithospermum erythrorhizon]|nr:hypothetical protein Leryth_014101 [Lithospermum erythrorhizon]
MKADNSAANVMITSDFQELGSATKELADHAMMLGAFGLGSSFFKYLASFAAIVCTFLDMTNWKTNILTTLLIPYIFFSLPSSIFQLVSNNAGETLVNVAVILRLFFPKHFPDWLELPAALILLIAVAPSLVVYELRGTLIGLLICLGIGCYLSSIGRIQELFHQNQWDIQHCWDHSYYSISMTKMFGIVFLCVYCDEFWIHLDILIF